MTDNREQFAERVSELVEAAGGFSEFARKCGVSPSVARKWTRGESDPKREHLIQVAEGMGVDLEWLAVGVGDKEQGPAPDLFQIGYVQSGKTENMVRSLLSSLGYNLIPQYDVTASAGGGAFVEEESEIGRVAFRDDWLEMKGLNRKDLRIITNEGDSMEPLIRDGSMLLVDIGRSRDLADGNYVLRFNGHLVTKRLQADLPDRILIRSENPAYRDRELSFDQARELDICGRVVWHGTPLV